MSLMKHAPVAALAKGLGLRGSRAVGRIWKAFFDFAGMLPIAEPIVAVPFTPKRKVRWFDPSLTRTGEAHYAQSTLTRVQSCPAASPSETEEWCHQENFPS